MTPTTSLAHRASGAWPPYIAQCMCACVVPNHRRRRIHDMRLCDAKPQTEVHTCHAPGWCQTTGASALGLRLMHVHMTHALGLYGQHTWDVWLTPLGCMTRTLGVYGSHPWTVWPTPLDCMAHTFGLYGSHFWAAWPTPLGCMAGRHWFVRTLVTHFLSLVSQAQIITLT